MLPKTLIILGGGASVRDGIQKGLFEFLPNTFCIGLNYAYKFVHTTATASIDETFHNSYFNEISELPLHIAKEHYSIQNKGKTVFLKPSNIYDYSLVKGVYNQTLVGLFTLSLGVYLLEEGSRIFLLGYDNGQYKDSEGNLCVQGNIPLTHWYQGELYHRGIGRLNWYTATSIDYEDTQKRISQAEREYRVYKDAPVKIYNVSPNSNIPTFEKINYDNFLHMIQNETYYQADLRNILREEVNFIKYQQTVMNRN